MKQTLHLEIEFRKNPYGGTYIALEGIDGSGKSTQAKKLKDYFESQGRVVTMTFEPNLTLFGSEDILKVFSGEKHISGQAFQYLLTANRLINHAEIVEPALKRGEVVITDRCFWSAVPYGIMDKELGYTTDQVQMMLLTQSILSMYHQTLIPDVVYYLALSADEAVVRLDSRTEGRKRDKYERKDKMERVIHGYEWIYEHFPGELTKIDAARGIEAVAKDLLQDIKVRFA